MPKYSPPEAFDFTKPASWPDWKTRFLRFHTLEKMHEEAGAIQVSALIYIMGRQAENIYKSFEFPPPVAPTETQPNPPDPKDDFQTVLDKFDAYFVPRKNTIFERTKFYQRVQHTGESVECFVRCLHDLAENCNFGENEQEYIRDRLIAGMLDTDLSRDLQMQQENLTLSEAVDKARHKELVQTNFNVSNSVHRINTPATSKKSNNKQKSGPHQNQSKTSKSGKRCQKCGYIHRSRRPDACPALVRRVTNATN